MIEFDDEAHRLNDEAQRLSWMTKLKSQIYDFQITDIRQIYDFPTWMDIHCTFDIDEIRLIIDHECEMFEIFLFTTQRILRVFLATLII